MPDHKERENLERDLIEAEVFDIKIDEIKVAYLEIAKEIGELKAKNQLTLERIERLEKLFLEHLKTADAHHPAIIKH